MRVLKFVILISPDNCCRSPEAYSDYLEHDAQHSNAVDMIEGFRKIFVARAAMHNVHFDIESPSVDHMLRSTGHRRAPMEMHPLGYISPLEQASCDERLLAISRLWYRHISCNATFHNDYIYVYAWYYISISAYLCILC